MINGLSMRDRDNLCKYLLGFIGLKIENLGDFYRGDMDCINGERPQAGQSDCYYKGYESREKIEQQPTSKEVD